MVAEMAFSTIGSFQSSFAFRQPLAESLGIATRFRPIPWRFGSQRTIDITYQSPARTLMFSEVDGKEDQPESFICTASPLLKNRSLYWIEEIAGWIYT